MKKVIVNNSDVTVIEACFCEISLEFAPDIVQVRISFPEWKEKFCFTHLSIENSIDLCVVLDNRYTGKSLPNRAQQDNLSVIDLAEKLIGISGLFVLVQQYFVEKPIGAKGKNLRMLFSDRMG